jgi:hypothetical protein
MPFEKGHPRFGGRKKGTPSRRKLTVEKVAETFLRMGVNPIERLCRIAKSKRLVPEHQLEALKELCRYYAPRLSTQHVSGLIVEVDLTHKFTRFMETASEDESKLLERIALALACPDEQGPVIDISAQPRLPAPVPVPVPKTDEEMER